ncbi:hypothetical protein OKA05_03800 [Luteolibacter arcticus]|uniref:Secreted protein n=1 Tax=Luteolibacter arcticus TaxID=1581411 RepID=A0ABT3GDF9_9BACT|nr:hypothetical protein [Luteolibacter arcticus]MCW1921662.1 hypothetical protein [Luteolibacter arcticus]
MTVTLAMPLMPTVATLAARTAIIATSAASSPGSPTATATATAAATTATAALVTAIAATKVTSAARIAVATPLARGLIITKLGLFFRRCIAPGPRRAQLECGQQALGQLIGRVAHAADTSGPAGNDKLALRQFERTVRPDFGSFHPALGGGVTPLFVDEQGEHQPDGDEPG